MAGRFSPWYHEKLTARVAKVLAREDHDNMRADVPDFPRPEPTRGAGPWSSQVPDVTAVRQGRLKIFEVETLDSLRDLHARDQWMAFSRFAREADAEFCVVGPKGLKGAAERALHDLRLEAAVMEASVLS